MCAPEEVLIKSPPPAVAMASASKIRGATSAAADQEDGADNGKSAAMPRRSLSDASAASTSGSSSSSLTTATVSETLSRKKVALWAVGGVALGGTITLISSLLPFLLAPHAASRTYHYAFYDYNPELSRFDNTYGTYGTDYLLAVVMNVLADAMLSSSLRSPHTAALQTRARGLLLCYMLSVAAGGLAHQFYIGVDARNTASFRSLWTVCVGTVCLASAFQGSIGAEIVRHDHRIGFKSSVVPVVPEALWVAYGVTVTAVCILGGMSYQRPACDIFIAGTTQLPSTLYMMSIMALSLPTAPLSAQTRQAGLVGLILNAPLLPMYPLLVQYTGWTLGTINALLHTWLLVAWSMQGLTLRCVLKALWEVHHRNPSLAVPIQQSRRQHSKFQ